jgi:hypothetical protein
LEKRSAAGSDYGHGVLSVASKSATQMARCSSPEREAGSAGLFEPTSLDLAAVLVADG